MNTKLLKSFFLLLFLINIGCSVEEKRDVKSVLKYVNPLIGTGFHGHTFPGAVVPHGRVQLSPDTHIFGWEASSGYHYADTTLYGFSHTHLSGTGIGDLGDILFLPFTGKLPIEKPVGSFSHDAEIATPGYYQVLVEPWKVKSELSATKRTGVHKYTFPKGEKSNLMIDLKHILQPDWGHKVIESELTIVDPYTIVGYRLTSGWAAYDPIWFKCVFDQPIVNSRIVVDGTEVMKNSVKGKEITCFLSFGNLDMPLNINVGISAVDATGASLNLKGMSDKTTFEEVVIAAEQIWEQELNDVQIETQNDDVLTNFYTALYHTKIAPMVATDIDGRYRGIDQKIHKSTNSESYTVYSLWDTYRSWYPLMTLINPERARIWAYDLYDKSEKGGLLPKWSLNGNYTGTMVGYPAVALLSDAFKKGLIDSIPEKLLQASVKSSKWQKEFNEKHKGTRAENVMPIQIYYKEKLGFVPVDLAKESVSYGLEMAYYDWCIAVMAEHVGDSALAMTYYEKGKAYQHYFDEEYKFMRGKKQDGSWVDGFNPRYSEHLKGEFVEGNSWQWTPFVPHAIPEFSDMLGGKEQLGLWLDKLFTEPSIIEGENASADITGLIGQYAHGNEPSHHVPFMYQFSDRPWRTQEVLDAILYDFYLPTPEGIIGNEDCGQMSAWYVLNAMGIYQVTTGKPVYTIGRPLVDNAKFRVKDGWFTINVINNSKVNMYVKQVKLNGVILKYNNFNYTDMKSGGVLEITMTDVH